MTDSRRIKLLLLAIIAILIASHARSSKADDYLVYTCCSWHAMKHNNGPADKNFQETNHGLGLEHEITPKWTFALGEYSNSIYGHSNYVGFMYYPYTISGFKLGAFVGDLTGYSDRKFGEPAIIPTITYQTSWGGINLEVFALPPVTEHWIDLDNRKSIFALQFKVKLP